jgi:putative tryptophan/tyrosine transport system substrate-binding protein
MDRRRFLLASLAGITPSSLIVQAQRTRLVRVGWLSVAPHPFIAAFRARLRDHGYVEGENLQIEERYVEGQASSLSRLAQELLARGIDVFVTSGAAAALAAKKSSTTVPIVAITASHVAAGLVQSLGHPGGNVAGLELLSADLSVKWLELLRTAVPNLRRVGVLIDTSVQSNQLEPMTAAASSAAVALVPLPVPAATAIDPAFARGERERVGGIVVLSSALFAAHKREIVGLAATHRMAAIYEHRDFVDASGLMSYGPNLDAVFQRAADYVDRIVKGASPADLPVEQPTKFELVINLKTAKTLGLTIPPSLLARADQVIE